MNDGIIALLLQWCLICLIWMGLMDKQLPQFGFSRKSALAVLAASLLTSFANWQLYFAPVEVNVGGVLIPCLLSMWLWHYLPKGSRNYTLAGSFLCATVLFMIKKVIIWDPILLIVNERILIPGVFVLLYYLITRNLQKQLFLLLLAFPLGDAFFQLSYLGYVTPITLGAPAAQDLLWSAIAMWLVAAVFYQLCRQGIFALVSLVRRIF